MRTVLKALQPLTFAPVETFTTGITTLDTTSPSIFSFISACKRLDVLHLKLQHFWLIHKNLEFWKITPWEVGDHHWNLSFLVKQCWGILFVVILSAQLEKEWSLEKSHGKMKKLLEVVQLESLWALSVNAWHTQICVCSRFVIMISFSDNELAKKWNFFSKKRSKSVLGRRPCNKRQKWSSNFINLIFYGPCLCCSPI